MNTNENVKVVLNAHPGSSEMADMITEVAREMVDTGCVMPDAFEDVFSIEVFTRPSGTKYAVVSFA